MQQCNIVGQVKRDGGIKYLPTQTFESRLIIKLAFQVFHSKINIPCLLL